jgi:hypothetical protein
MLKHVVWSSAAIVGLGGCFNLLFPYAPDQYAETLLRANCGFQYRCCEAAERSAQAPDEATCVEQGLESGSSTVLLGARAKAAIDAGKAEYDATLAETCLKKIVDASNACDAQQIIAPEADPACDAGFARAFTIGTVDAGDACTDDLECADEGVCQRDNEEGVISLAGVCVVVGGEGDDCGETFQCRRGLTCEFDGEESFTCEPIELGDVGDECGADAECASNLCLDSEVQTCSDSGTPCEDDSDCDEENFEFCDFDFVSACAEAPTVEICDGQE